jgi:hypothetical protein
MSGAVSSELLRLLADSTADEQAAVVRFIRDRRLDALKSENGPARFLFCKAGSYWRVVFDGCAEFLLPDTLGARYVDYLLHHPNRSISAFDLEVAIQPEKAEARSKNSFQEGADPEAARVYLRELTRLRREREEAAEDGQWTEADRLDEEIEALTWAVRGSGQAKDTGERARSNVNKALAAVRRRLAKGEKAEREFGEHIKRWVSVGYQCLYAHPPGPGWE